MSPAAPWLLCAALGAMAAAGQHTERTPRAMAEVGAEAGGEEDEAGALSQLAAVPEWRALWAAAGERVPREPTLNDTEGHLVAQLGDTAFLHCAVAHLGERQVTWVRRRDWHILSAGAVMYTNDERFQVLHVAGSPDWVLQLRYVSARDAGAYECQVSAGPRGAVLRRRVHVHVAAPEAFILGADEHHVHAGSRLSLVCIIEKSPVPPQYVFWYHNERMINYDAEAGVTVDTSPGPGGPGPEAPGPGGPGPELASPGPRTHSALTIRAAAPHHSGNYSCRAPNTQPANIYVYVTADSDKMAATLSRSAAAAGRALALGAAAAALALGSAAAALAGHAL